MECIVMNTAMGAERARTYHSHCFCFGRLCVSGDHLAQLALIDDRSGLC